MRGFKRYLVLLVVVRYNMARLKRLSKEEYVEAIALVREHYKTLSEQDIDQWLLFTNLLNSVCLYEIEVLKYKSLPLYEECLYKYDNKPQIGAYSGG